MCDGHREIVAQFEKFNEDESKARSLRDNGDKPGQGVTRSTMATSALARATNLMKLQSTRLKNLIWEIEQAV